MSLRNHPPEIERWKLNLVRARAYRLGFRGADLDDAQQDVLMALIMFRFQPDRANGANEATALVALIDRRLWMARRRQGRYQRRLRRVQQWTTPESATVDAEQGAQEEKTERRLDVGKLISELGPQDRLLCEALAAEESIDSIAKRLQCSWHTVKRRIEQLRGLFEKMGVDGYVQ